MSDQVSQLIDELSQLCSQYKNEVPGSRRAWPKSIKERVARLLDCGLGASEIARATGIAYYTVHKWSGVARPAAGPLKQKGHFLPVSVADRFVPLPKRRPGRPKKTSPVTVTVPERPTSIATVTVTAPNGLRIEGLGVEDLLRLLPVMSGGGR